MFEIDKLVAARFGNAVIVSKHIAIGGQNYKNQLTVEILYYGAYFFTSCFCLLNKFGF